MKNFLIIVIIILAVIMIPELLSLFGITPDKYPFLVLAILIVAGVIYLRVVLGQTNKTINKIKLNIKAIVTFLATTPRSKLDTSLIESMSPLQIKEAGYTILEESGFKTIMENAEYKSKVLACISDQNPTAKLDVEKYSIVYFSTLLENEFMTPIKTYLYNHPEKAEIFPTLAGLFIRDEYLKVHTEITQ